MDLNIRAFKGPDTNPAISGWPVLSSIVAGAVNANQAGVAQDNTAAQQKPGKVHVVCGWTFSVDRATTSIIVLQLVEDLAGTPVIHEQIEIPIGFVGSIPVNYPKPIECQAGKSVALITNASAGAGVKTTGCLRGYSTRV
jgi:hypothetical protein